MSQVRFPNWRSRNDCKFGGDSPDKGAQANLSEYEGKPKTVEVQNCQSLCNLVFMSFEIYFNVWILSFSLEIQPHGVCFPLETNMLAKYTYLPKLQNGLVYEDIKMYTNVLATTPCLVEWTTSAGWYFTKAAIAKETKVGRRWICCPSNHLFSPTGALSVTKHHHWRSAAFGLPLSQMPQF